MKKHNIVVVNPSYPKTKNNTVNNIHIVLNSLPYTADIILFNPSYMKVK